MVGLTVNELQARIIELEDDLRVQGQAGERIAELQAEVNVLLERNTALQTELNVQRDQVERWQWEATRLERQNSILEQRLRRIGDAVVEGRVVDGS